jgi:hypothetical protein
VFLATQSWVSNAWVSNAFAAQDFVGVSRKLNLNWRRNRCGEITGNGTAGGVATDDRVTSQYCEGNVGVQGGHGTWTAEVVVEALTTETTKGMAAARTTTPATMGASSDVSLILPE